MATKKDIQVCFNPHFDSVSLWIGSFGGADSPCDISRGVFAARQGVPRILEMMDRYGIKTTWDITGHSIESFPKESELIVKYGHELGVHGYTHENPLAMSRQQEADVLDKCIELVTDLCGVRPVGYVAPWWELSPNTIDLLLERDFLYDRSVMEDDYTPHYLRRGDSWTKIDYTQEAKTWMKPWQPGEAVELVELPASWYLDDAPPMMFVKTFPNSHGWVNPRDVEDIWRDQFDWIYRHYDYAIYTCVIHPDCAGKPQVLMMLERLFDHMLAHEGVRMSRCGRWPRTSNAGSPSTARPKARPPRTRRGREPRRRPCVLRRGAGGGKTEAQRKERPCRPDPSPRFRSSTSAPISRAILPTSGGSRTRSAEPASGWASSWSRATGWTRR